MHLDVSGLNALVDACDYRLQLRWTFNRYGFVFAK